MWCRVSRSLRVVVLTGCLASVATAQPAASSARDQARSLGLAGVEAFQAAQYEEASEKLEQAYSLMNVPSLGLWSGRALAKRGLLVEAANRYFDVASLQVPQGDAVVQRQAQLDAQAELEQLRPQIPRLVVRVTGVEATELALKIDGQPVPSSALGKPRLVNPGSHAVEVRAGARVESAVASTRTGEETAVSLDFGKPAGASVSAAPPLAPDRSRPAPAAGSTQRTLGWVSLAVGGVGLSLGGATGALALNKRSQLKDDGCSDSTCPSDKQSEVDSLDTLRTVSSVGFIAGGVLAATGLVLVLTSPSSKTELSAELSNDRITLKGRF